MRKVYLGIEVPIVGVVDELREHRQHRVDHFAALARVSSRYVSMHLPQVINRLQRARHEAASFGRFRRDGRFQNCDQAVQFFWVYVLHCTVQERNDLFLQSLPESLFLFQCPHRRYLGV